MAEASQYEAAVLYEEARVRRAEGNSSGALARYRRLLEMTAELGDRAQRAEILAEVAEMYQQTYELLESRRWYEKARALFQELGKGERAAWTLYKTAQVVQLIGDTMEAEQLYRDAAEALGRCGEARTEALARAARGQLLWEMKRESEGVPELVAAFARLRALQAPEAETVCGQIRAWSGRVGSVSYRKRIEAAASDPEILRLLTG